MAGVQSSQVNSVFPFLLGNQPALVRENETILTDASRVSTKDLAQYTLMGQIASTKKWVPWTSVTATDGSALPMGILMNDGGVTAAAIIAGDVTGVSILVGGAGLRINESLIVFDTGYNGGVTALTLDTVFSGNAAGSGSATPYLVFTARRFLEMKGLFAQTTIAFDLPEN